MRTMTEPRTAIRPRETRKLKACAMKPIKGGPKRKPKHPMVETAASATPGESILERPAALYTSGMTEETPAPTNKKPVVAGKSQGKRIAVNNPEVISSPLTWRTRLIPHLVTIQSPRKRPEAMVAIKAVNPTATSSV